MMAFLGGASGSLVAQIFSVPIDVISQHMMLSGQKGSSQASKAAKHVGDKVKEIDRIRVPESLKSASSFRIFKYICSEIFKNENLKGFYRGYMLSTFLVSLNSALWWPFYYFYQGL
jgi:solute carrier family 25 protein 44